WWLLAIVPVLLLAGLVAFGVMRSRSRRDQDDVFAVPGQDYDSSDYDPHDYDPSPGTAGTQTGTEDGRESALFGDSYAREGLRSLSSAPPATPSSEDFTPDPASFWGARVP
ncbi:hypothetical protein C6A85_72545, partial [Mycobacterium sp. ITM-2017-0098]